MCCYFDKEYTKKKLNRLKKEGKTFIYAYKGLYSNGDAPYGDMQYRPGYNKCLENTYDLTIDNYCVFMPTGLHLRPQKKQINEGRFVVRVKVYVKDIVGFGRQSSFRTSGDPIDEIVVKQLYISREDWDNAGLSD